MLGATPTEAASGPLHNFFHASGSVLWLQNYFLTEPTLYMYIRNYTATYNTCTLAKNLGRLPGDIILCMIQLHVYTLQQTSKLQRYHMSLSDTNVSINCIHHCYLSIPYFLKVVPAGTRYKLQPQGQWG